MSEVVHIKTSTLFHFYKWMSFAAGAEPLSVWLIEYWELEVLTWNCLFVGLNTWCHSNSVSFKSHSISVTFKFCTVLVALCVPEPRSTDSLGTQHCKNFESHSNRVTFETNAIRMTSSIQAQKWLLLYSKVRLTMFAFSNCNASPLVLLYTANIQALSTPNRLSL